MYYKVYVKTVNDNQFWYTNAMIYGSKKEAEDAARDLSSRWMLVEKWMVKKFDDSKESPRTIAYKGVKGNPWKKGGRIEVEGDFVFTYRKKKYDVSYSGTLPQDPHNDRPADLDLDVDDMSEDLYDEIWERVHDAAEEDAWGQVAGGKEDIYMNPRQKLLTAEIIKKIPPLYTYENTPKSQVPIAVKFFTPDANWTWYVTEGEKQEGGDWMFFGLVDGFEKELGYFSLRELESVRGRMGLGVERDAHFGRHTLAEAIEKRI